MKYQVPKGTRDFYGPNFVVRKETSEKILKVMETYGFQQVQTPIIESQELLQAMAGEEMVGQIYTLTDKGGRKLGLRSDITPALTRLFVNTATSLSKPIKYSCFDRVYRYESPQKGRYREIYQINGEEFGAPAPLADAELLACMYDCYAAVGLGEVNAIIGYRPLLGVFVAGFGITKAQQEEVIRTLDKKDKISPEDFIQSLLANGIKRAEVPRFEEFIALRGQANDVLQKARSFFANNQAALGYLDDLEKIVSRLDSFGVKKRSILQLSLARGSEYYTGIIFEFITPEAPFSIGGGGRYDNLVSIFGGNASTAAVGFSIGFERVIDILEERNKGRATTLAPDVFIAFDPYNLRYENKAVATASKLRRRGKVVELNVLRKSTSEQIELAKKKGAREIIVIRDKD